MARAVQSLRKRLGLTGKIVLHVGWILALAVSLPLGSAWFMARKEVRRQLRAAEIARVEGWSARHADLFLGQDRWGLAVSLDEILRHPYALFAAVFDRVGMSAGEVGDGDAHLRAGTLDLLIPIRSSRIDTLRRTGGSVPLPGPGAAAAIEGEGSYRDRLRRALDGELPVETDVVGWVAVTLSTEPLDALVAGAVGRAALMGLLALSGGLALTWALAQSLTRPIRSLRDAAESIARQGPGAQMAVEGGDGDDLGDLAAQFRIMARRLGESRSSVERDAAARLAHDLKTPLTALKASAELLLDEAKDDPEARERFLDAIRRESDRMAAMIDAWRPGGDADALSPAPAVGAGETKVLVASGRDELRRLIREAIESDGAQVSEAGDPLGTLRLSRELAPDAVVLDLTMGDGEAFSILGDLSRDSRGRGVVLVPFGAVDDGEALRPGAVSYQGKPLQKALVLSAARRVAPGGDGRARILVVDDDRFVAEAVASMLEREGFETSVALGGEEALRAAEDRAPDIVILDLTMPGIGGMEVIRRLRQRAETRERPVILMTGHEVPEAHRDGWPAAAISRDALAREIARKVRESVARAPGARGGG